jgi:release factor glutamine methyltransferase
VTPTVRELLGESTARLAATSDTPRLDAEILLAHACGRDRGWLYAWPEHRPEPAVMTAFLALIDQRASGRPVAYLTGEREFWSLAFKVDEHTLIPRPETELLVATVLELTLPERARVLDLGTGSGAIAIALATERPGWQITATDRSPRATAAARANALALGTNIDLFTGDWFDAIDTDSRFDLIVSNPPYVADGDPHLSRGDVRFEPSSALAAGTDGLRDLRTIAAAAPAFLADGGWLWLEHGLDQGDAVARLLQNRGFEQVRTVNDMAGLPRISGGRWGNRPTARHHD